MALSGSVTTSADSNGRSVTLYWDATQSVSNNQSTISWSLEGSGSYGGYVVVSEIRVTIDGSEVYYRGSSNHTNCYQGTYLAGGTKTITHNNDGTRSFSIKVEAGIYQWAINCSGSNTFTLNTIPRASTITSAGNVTLGNACSVKWTPASSSFKYKVKFTLGNYDSGYSSSFITPNTTSAYTYTGFTIPLTVANQLPSATTGTMTVYLASYNSSGTQVGSTASKTFTVTVPSTVIPTIGTVVAEIVNTNSTISGWNVAVAGYSKVKVTATASGSYGSTISSFKITGGYSTTQSGTSLSYTGAVITSSGSKTFTVTATDSRGRTSTAVVSSAVTFYAYSEPSVTSFTAQRDEEVSTNMIIKANWTMASVNGHNAATAILYYKKSTASSWTNYGAITKNTNVTLSNLDEASSYNFKVTVTDSLSKSSSEETFVSTIGVLLDFRAGGKGLGIGKIAESNKMEVALDSVFIGNVYIKIGANDISLKNYIKGVMDGTY